MFYHSRLLFTEIKLLILCSIFVILGFFTLEAKSLKPATSEVNSLSIQSNRTESSDYYLIEIYVEGVKTSSINFESDFQTLYLLAHQGSSVSETSVSGAQVIKLAYDFPADANLKNYFRENKRNKILISIPKS